MRLLKGVKQNISEAWTSFRNNPNLKMYVAWAGSYLFLLFGMGFAIYEVETESLRRSENNQKSIFDNCIRNNYQDTRDRQQDQVLLSLLNVVLDPKIPTEQARKIFVNQRNVLDERVHSAPPTNGELKRLHSTRPVNCHDMASQRRD